MAKRFNINKIIDTKINSLLVLAEDETHITSGGNKHRTLLCKCDCGKIKKFQLSDVINNITKSCGCYSAKIAKIRMSTFTKTHGETLTSEYNTWLSMKKRCNNINHKSYNYYGGIGIKVCDRWQNSYENFIIDVGKKPSKEYSLDRIDGTKGYYKENCRWATNLEQCRNLKNNILFEYNNQIKCVGEWCEVFKLSRYKTIKILKENGKIINKTP